MNKTQPKKLSYRKPAHRMSIPELEELSKYFDREFTPTRPLTKADKADLARAARRGRGRPRVGEGAKRVLVSIEGGLLRQVDAYCKQNKLQRAELISRCLRKAVSA